VMEKVVCSSKVFGKDNTLGNTLGVAVCHGPTPLFEDNGVQPSHGGVRLFDTIINVCSVVDNAN
jgi:hypothetical protein